MLNLWAKVTASSSVVTSMRSRVPGVYRAAVGTLLR